MTTASTCDNYLIARLVAQPKTFVLKSYQIRGTTREGYNRPPEYEPMVIGPFEVPDDELFLPIKFNRDKTRFA